MASSSSVSCTAGEESTEATFDTTHEGSGSDAGSSSSDTVPSLLSRLRAPSHSDIMRKRKVR